MVKIEGATPVQRPCNEGTTPGATPVQRPCNGGATHTPYTPSVAPALGGWVHANLGGKADPDWLGSVARFFESQTSQCREVKKEHGSTR